MYENDAQKNKSLIDMKYGPNGLNFTKNRVQIETNNSPHHNFDR